jgi:signal transduction histidine kinase
VLAVSDEGAGFPASFVAHAFERFSRADASRTGAGAGLGLAIVDVIARAHGGVASVEPTRASTVRLELPSRLNAVDVAGADSRRVR